MGRLGVTGVRYDLDTLERLAGDASGSDVTPAHADRAVSEYQAATDPGTVAALVRVARAAQELAKYEWLTQDGPRAVPAVVGWHERFVRHHDEAVLALREALLVFTQPETGE